MNEKTPRETAKITMAMQTAMIASSAPLASSRSWSSVVPWRAAAPAWTCGGRPRIMLAVMPSVMVSMMRRTSQGTINCAPVETNSAK